MIGTIDVNIQAAKPNFPLAPVRAFVNSPSNVRLRNVPREIGQWKIERVFFSANYPDNRTVSVECVLVGGVWVGTIDGSTAPGKSANGYAVTANGKDERGESVEGYVLGRGDVDILDADGEITVGETTYYVHILDAEPETPHKGDLCKIGGAWKLYNGSAWETIGGGGGGAVDSVNGKTGAVVLTGGDIPYIGETTVSGKLSALTLAVGDAESAAATAKATAETAQRTADDAAADASNAIAAAADAGTKAEEAKEEAKLVRMVLVGDGTAANPYAVQLDGVALTFAQIKDYAVTRSAVIQHGQGTYRVTYVGASEMMWDCTGTVQGVPKTGMIHIFAAGNVVQLVAAKELLTPSALPYKLNADGTIADRAINAVTSGAWTIPSGFTDLLIRYTGAPVSLTFAESSIVDFGDALPSESGDYLVTVTRTKANEAFVRVLEITERA